MAVNKDPFVRTSRKDGLPYVFKGLVQAGSDQAIKAGELCALNKTAGYWTPVDAASDAIYRLAISKEEQKSDDGSRYMEFYGLAPGDQFEFACSAEVTALELGDTFVISDSQTLANAITSWPIATCVDDGHYPQDEDTTIRNRSYAVVEFGLSASIFGYFSGHGRGLKKVVGVTTAQTLYKEMDGLILITTASGNTTGHVLPSDAPYGCTFGVIAAGNFDIGFDPGSAGAIYVEGSKQTDDREVTVDAIGDGFFVVSAGNGDWHAYAMTALAADPTGAVDIAGS